MGDRTAFEALYFRCRDWVFRIAFRFCGNEDEILAMIGRKLGSSRIFSFGVGDSVNRYLIDRMASFGRGAVAYAGLDESAVVYNALLSPAFALSSTVYRHLFH